jgi:SAM-dependent methyltransferase
MKTYTFSPQKATTLVREAFCLYRIHTREVARQVSGSISFLRYVESRVEQATGMRLEGRKVLIIGPGQGRQEMVYFGQKNEVVGIDLDVIAHSLDPRTYVRMLRQNGLMRTTKTLVRKGLGLDRLAARELKKQLGIRRFPPTPILQMDASEMTFPDHSFDFIYTFSVLEHIPDPEAALREIERVLRPDGACYLSLHLYTSEGGCHDPRVFANDPARPPYWAHLRPQHQAEVQPNAYLNRLSLAEWKRLFQQRMPGVQFATDGFHKELHAQLSAELSRLRAGGELAEYSDEELLSVNLIAQWRKPKETPPAQAVVQSALEPTASGNRP